MWHLLEVVSSLERGMAELYETFAELFRDVPPAAAFWREMAAEERIHALIVAAAREVFPATTPSPAGDWAGPLNELSDRLRAVTEEARRGMSLDRAFERAEELESSELNAISALIIRQAGDGFSRLAPLVADAKVERHCDKVARMRERLRPASVTGE